MSAKKEYWTEYLQEEFKLLGISVTPAQFELLVEGIIVHDENYGLVCGHDSIPNPLLAENQRLKRELEQEKRKETCPDCRGRGTSAINYKSIGRHSTNCCFTCKGDGKI